MAATAAQVREAMSALGCKEMYMCNGTYSNVPFNGAILGCQLHRRRHHEPGLCQTAREVADRVSALDDEQSKVWQERFYAAQAEVERLQGLVADYEHCITWDTTCKNCATLLDGSLKETQRAERAEAERDALRAEVEHWKGEMEDHDALCSDAEDRAHAAEAEVKRLRDVVDAAIHYRNLAIENGAQPTDMLTRYDADLCRGWSTMNHEGGWRNDQPEIWEELEAAEAKVAAGLALHAGHSHAPDGKTWTTTCLGCDRPWPCPTLTALSGPSEPTEGDLPDPKGMGEWASASMGVAALTTEGEAVTSEPVHDHTSVQMQGGEVTFCADLTDCRVCLGEHPEQGCADVGCTHNCEATIQEDLKRRRQGGSTDE